MFQWYRNTDMILGSMGRINISTTAGASGMRVSSLTIINATFEDTAKYTCQVYTQSPTIDGITTTTNLTVVGKFP